MCLFTYFAAGALAGGVTGKVYAGAVALLVGCGSGGSSSGEGQGTIGDSGAQMDIFQVSNGFGTLLPHTTFKADSNGFPTTTPIAIRSMADLTNNVTGNNPILASPQWPTTIVRRGFG